MNEYVLNENSYGQRFIPLFDDDNKGPNDKDKAPIGYLAPQGQKSARRLSDFPPNWMGFKNYGIALDGQYLVVDFDTEHPERDKFEKRLPKTWTQQTRKGKHFLYLVPEGFRGGNAKMRASDGAILGDLKSLGYIVCPGSVVLGHRYELLNPGPIVDAPDWLIALLGAKNAPETASSGPGFDILPDGARDNSLHKIASNLRGIGYNQNAIEKALSVFVREGFIEQPEGREVEKSDIQRIARSASKYETETQYDVGSLVPSNLINGADVKFVGPPISWWVRYFIPKHELITMYGKGGIGKSTFLSWLTAEVTRQGGTVAVCVVEEPFSRFVARAVLSGADRTKIYGIPNASQIAFPRDGDLLRDLLAQLPVDLLIFDSIYTHFESVSGQNMAERARSALSTLAEIAQNDGPTVIGNFHENKLGNYLGSVEMENVARVMLKFSRKKNKGLRAHVEKTNKRAPDYDLEFPGLQVVICDPETNETQMETNDEGELVPETIVVAQTPKRIDLSKEEDEEEAEDAPPGYVNLSQLEEPKEHKYDHIREYAKDHPEESERKIAEVLGLGRTIVRKALGRYEFPD